MKIKIHRLKFCFFLAFVSNLVYGVEISPVHLKENEDGKRGQLSEELMRMIREIFDVNAFVETGTCYGRTTAVAAQIFPRVFTVELSEPLYRTASEKLKKFPNVKTYQGLSQNCLQEIVPIVSSAKTLFFLDAHYSEENTARGPQNTPVLLELEIVLRNCPKCVILIDDVRLFQPAELITTHVKQTGKTSLLGYPSLSQIRDLARKLRPDVKFCILGDIALLYSQSKFPKIEISPAIEAMTTTRLLDEHQITPSNDAYAMKREMALIKAGKDTCEILLDNFIRSETGIMTPAAYTTHYHLWSGLCLLGMEKNVLALEQFRMAKSFGLDRPRIANYIRMAEKGI